MKSKRILNDAQKVYILVFESGEEILSNLKAFVKEHHLSAAQLTAIGAFSKAQLGFFDFDKKDYHKIAVTEQTEVLSFLGDISLKPDGSPQLHVHVVLGKADGTAHGGHLLSATAHPTLEVIITESPAYIKRKYDSETGLALMDPDQ